MKRRLFCLLAALILVLSCVSCRRNYDFVSAMYTVQLNSTNAFVYDYSDGDVNKMYGTESEVVYPASITKLLTALTALDILPADTVITPDDEVYFTQDGSSSAYIRPHHQLTLEMLIEAMMLPSGNDAAYAVAAACGIAADDSGYIEYTDDGGCSREDAVEVFVMRMNEYARKLGCTGSNFTVPDGFAGEENHSTLDDMLLICKAAAENEIIAKYAAMQSDDVVYASGHTNTWINTNKMLDPESEFYNEHVMGLKTGSLEGNYSLVILYDDGEDRLLIGVFGAEDDLGRYEDISALIEAELEAKEYEKEYK